MLLVSSGKGQVQSGSAFPGGRRRRKGKRGRERGRVPEGPGRVREIVTGVTSLEAMTRERKEGKEGLYCMGSTRPLAGARR